MVPSFQFDGWAWVVGALSTPVILWAGWPFHRFTLLNVRHGATTMDTLVTIGTLAGELELSTTSGDVDIKAVSGGDVRVQTVSGDVRVGIARGTRTWIDAGSVSGKLESELGLEDAEPADVPDASGPVVPLRVKTVSGDVSVVRAGAAISA